MHIQGDMNLHIVICEYLMNALRWQGSKFVTTPQIHSVEKPTSYDVFA